MKLSLPLDATNSVQ